MPEIVIDKMALENKFLQLLDKIATYQLTVAKPSLAEAGKLIVAYQDLMAARDARINTMLQLKGNGTPE